MRVGPVPFHSRRTPRDHECGPVGRGARAAAAAAEWIATALVPGKTVALTLKSFKVRPNFPFPRRGALW